MTARRVVEELAEVRQRALFEMRRDEKQTAKLIAAHQYKCHHYEEFVCKAGCRIPMLAGELMSDSEARHQAAILGGEVLTP